MLLKIENEVIQKTDLVILRLRRTVYDDICLEAYRKSDPDKIQNLAYFPDGCSHLRLYSSHVQDFGFDNDENGKLKVIK